MPNLVELIAFSERQKPKNAIARRHRHHRGLPLPYGICAAKGCSNAPDAASVFFWGIPLCLDDAMRLSKGETVEVDEVYETRPVMLESCDPKNA